MCAEVTVCRCATYGGNGGGAIDHLLCGLNDTTQRLSIVNMPGKFAIKGAREVKYVLGREARWSFGRGHG